MPEPEKRPRWTMTVVLISTAAVFVIAVAVSWRLRATWDAGILVSSAVVAFLWFVVAVLPILLRRLN